MVQTRVKATARLPPPLAQTGLNIGNRMLVLPPGRWFAAPAGGRTVMGGHIRAGPVKIDPVALTTLWAFELSASGGLAGAVAFSANAKQAYGISYGNVDEPCALRDALIVDRFHIPYDQPECLTVRVVTPALARNAADLAPALQAAQAAGATLPAAAYEVRYARYGLIALLVDEPTSALDPNADRRPTIPRLGPRRNHRPLRVLRLRHDLGVKPPRHAVSWRINVVSKHCSFVEIVGGATMAAATPHV